MACNLTLLPCQRQYQSGRGFDTCQMRFDRLLIAALQWRLRSATLRASKYEKFSGRRVGEQRVVQEQPSVTGVILSGGQSSRMGQNKSLMMLGERRLIDRVVDVLCEVFTDLMIVTNAPDVYADLGLSMVGDVFPHKGSLGGIYSAIHHVSTPYCFVVACDMPFLNAALMRYMMSQMTDYDVVMPDIEGNMQPLHAIYSKACLTPIQQRLVAGRLKIVGFLSDVRVRTVTTDEVQHFDPQLLAFQNLNTPEEFHMAVERLGLLQHGH